MLCRCGSDKTKRCSFVKIKNALSLSHIVVFFSVWFCRLSVFWTKIVDNLFAFWSEVACRQNPLEGEITVQCSQYQRHIALFLEDAILICSKHGNIRRMCDGITLGPTHKKTVPSSPPQARSSRKEISQKEHTLQRCSECRRAPARRAK